MSTPPLTPQEPVSRMANINLVDGPHKPSTWASFSAIIRLEIERLVTTSQGLFYLITFIVFWFLLLKFVILNGANFIFDQRFSGKGWSSTLFITYLYVGLFIFPSACIFISANQTGGDRKRGTLRFLVLRCHRDVIFLGRFFAQVVIQYLFILLTLLTILVNCFFEHGFFWGDIKDASIVTANLALALLPFIAMMAFLSATLKSPRQATSMAALIWMLAIALLSMLSHYFPILEPLKMIVPGMQFSALKELEGADMFQLAYIPLIQTAIFLLLGHISMKREAL